MTNVTVIDTIMGAGKTSYIIEHMNRTNVETMFDGSQRRFIYVTPLLDEVERVKQACPDLSFKDPKPVHGRKYFGLQKLIDDRENIATTHELFKMLTQDTRRALLKANYTLVIDEVLTCCDIYGGLTKDDQDDLFQSGKMYVDDITNRLRWNHDDHGQYEGKFSPIKHLCDNGNLASYADGKRGKRLMIWQFPTEFLECFEQTYVLTYLFEGSPMRSYLKAERVSFEMKAVSGDWENGYRLVCWHDHNEAEIKASIRELVNVYEGRGNDIGTQVRNEQPLSSSWFKRADAATLARLRGNTVTFFKNHAKTRSRENAWTTFKSHRTELKGAAYSGPGCWIPLNTKATNAFAHKRSMAYLANRFSLPVLRNFFTKKGIEVNDDLFAISEMVQVLWRTAIRNGEPVHLYIPSERMRGLFKAWLHADSTTELCNQLRRLPVRLAA
ncbi:MAG: hypothetical protein ABJF86_03140 [Tateyamaria sp.]|uniref:hypothetical protein n=1 Tax=Alphaproteobacteria TaxID=28211 RepID=UPI0032876170